ncbi:MAG: hypothetical protein M3R08_04230, partial [Bacteroidota bacterium]|nr:hypothetical protein [Bacteroidota bacterium]
MKVRFIISLHLFLSLSWLSAQTTFNAVQHHPNGVSYSGGLSVFEQTNGYLVFSSGWALDTAIGAVQITKYDLNGVFQWQKEHRRQRNVYTGLMDPIAETSEGQFVGAMTEFGNSEPTNIYLYWWNSEGDTVQTRFMRSDSASHGTRQLVALSDGGFLHCGWCAGYAPGTGGCITRLDSSGEVLWEQNYPQTHATMNAVEMLDGGFLLGGVRGSTLDEAVVVRTDIQGDVVWIRYHGNYSSTSGKRALLANDGSILMPGSWKNDPAWSVNDRWASLYQYSAMGVPQSRKDYYYSYNALNTYILPKGANNYWLIGGMYQYYVDPDYVTMLYELDENLDSLWMRRYWYYAPDDAESAVSCVRATSDGGLVMCGSTRQGVTDSLPYLTSNWLIKLDQDGCLVPGCTTLGVSEYAMDLNGYFSVSPNPLPTGATLNLNFDPPQGFTPTGDLRLVLLDPFGRIVLEKDLGDHLGPYGLSLPQLSGGIYH